MRCDAGRWASPRLRRRRYIELRTTGFDHYGRRLRTMAPTAARQVPSLAALCDRCRCIHHHPQPSTTRTQVVRLRFSASCGDEGTLSWTPHWSKNRNEFLRHTCRDGARSSACIGCPARMRGRRVGRRRVVERLCGHQLAGHGSAESDRYVRQRAARDRSALRKRRMDRRFKHGRLWRRSRPFVGRRPLRGNFGRLVRLRLPAGPGQLRPERRRHERHLPVRTGRQQCRLRHGHRDAGGHRTGARAGSEP